MKLTGERQSGAWAVSLGATVDSKLLLRIRAWCKKNKVTLRSATEVALTEFLDKQDRKATRGDVQ